MLWQILEKALNACLQGDPLTPLYLHRIAGKTLEIRVRGLGINLSLAFNLKGIKIYSALKNKLATPDAIITGTPLTLLRASKHSAAGSAQLEISGDLALVQTIQTWLAESAMDWEAYLSQWVGDVFAHEIAKQLRNFQSRRQTSVMRLTQNCTEYLQEEYRQLPSRLEIEEFLTDVDAIHDDVERLTVRCQRIQTVFNATFMMVKEVK